MADSSTFLSGDKDISTLLLNNMSMSKQMKSTENDNVGIIRTSNMSANCTRNNERCGKTLIQIMDESSSSSSPSIPSSSKDDVSDDEDMITNNMSADECPPPLLDWNESSISNYPTKNDEKVTIQYNNNQQQASLMEQMTQEAIKARKEKETKKQEASRKNNTKMNFGLKKGFLNSNSKSSKKSKLKTKTQKEGTDKEHDKKLPQHVQGKESDVIYELDEHGNMVPTKNTASSYTKNHMNRTGQEQIPTIRPTQQKQQQPPPSVSSTTNAKKSSLYLDEVQDAMKKNNKTQNLFNHLSNHESEWKTPDFLDQISKNPILSSGMNNPKFVSALEALQMNPKQAMEQFRNHPDIIEFLNEFCNVMGNHFLKLGQGKDNEQHKKKKMVNDMTMREITDQNSSSSKNGNVKNTNHNDHLGPMARDALQKEKERRENGHQSWNDEISKKEKEKLDSIMADQELTSLLMDVDMQRVMKECSSIPGKMNMYMHHEVYGPKMRKMIQAGLLQVV